MTHPGVKLTLGGEEDEGIGNLQRSIQDAGSRSD